MVNFILIVKFNLRNTSTIQFKNNVQEILQDKQMRTQNTPTSWEFQSEMHI